LISSTFCVQIFIRIQTFLKKLQRAFKFSDFNTTKRNKMTSGTSLNWRWKTTAETVSLHQICSSCRISSQKLDTLEVGKVK